MSHDLRCKDLETSPVIDVIHITTKKIYDGLRGDEPGVIYLTLSDG